MPRTRPDTIEAPGQDSFLDIVANLVGILLILIMVIGARATDAMVRNMHEPQEPGPQIDVAAARAAAESVEQDIHEVDARIKRQELEIAYRRRERDRMLQVIGQVEQELDGEKQNLNDEQRAQVDVQRQLAMARDEWEDLHIQLEALRNAPDSPQVIKHLPTPMAKTVFGRELHFRLHAGRIAYVPWDELVERLQEDAPNQIGKLRDAPRVTESIGPIHHFRMTYTLRHSQDGRRAELERFVLVPTRNDLGERVEDIANPSSQFENILSQYDPNRTTVTVWVYPDSFEQFRELKMQLFRRGYAAAGRPLPAGHPIGGSPEGTRSAAQ